MRLAFDAVADLGGGGIYGRRGDRAVIVLSPDLGRIERNEVLGHELIHDERRITSPSASDLTMEREEAIVRAEVARRLVPLDELHEFVTRTVTVEPVTARLVAQEFDVTEPTAQDALVQLQTTLNQRRNGWEDG